MSDNENEPTLEQKYDDLKLRYDSLVKAVQKLELKLQASEHDNQVLRTQLINADQNIAQQKTALVNAIRNNNEVQQEMAQEISGLKGELKNYGHND